MIIEKLYALIRLYYWKKVEYDQELKGGTVDQQLYQQRRFGQK